MRLGFFLLAPFAAKQLDYTGPETKSVVLAPVVVCGEARLSRCMVANGPGSRASTGWPLAAGAWIRSALSDELVTPLAVGESPET